MNDLLTCIHGSMDRNNLLFESYCHKQAETLLSLLIKNLLTNFSEVKVKKKRELLGNLQNSSQLNILGLLLKL